MDHIFTGYSEVRSSPTSALLYEPIQTVPKLRASFALGPSNALKSEESEPHREPRKVRIEESGEASNTLAHRIIDHLRFVALVRIVHSALEASARATKGRICQNMTQESGNKQRLTERILAATPVSSAAATPEMTALFQAISRGELNTVSCNVHK
jgi:hypothetical protein